MRNTLPATYLISAALMLGCGLVHAEPVVLSDSQLDQISAGAQYSVVSGGGFAESGIVMAQASTRAMEKHGITMTMAVLKVKATGTGLSAFGMGESGVGNAVSGVYGYASSPQGKIKIQVVTGSLLRPDGSGVLGSMVLVKASGSPAQVTQSVTTF